MSIFSVLLSSPGGVAALNTRVIFWPIGVPCGDGEHRKEQNLAWSLHGMAGRLSTVASTQRCVAGAVGTKCQRLPNRIADDTDALITLSVSSRARLNDHSQCIVMVQKILFVYDGEERMHVCEVKL